MIMRGFHIGIFLDFVFFGGERLFWGCHFLWCAAFYSFFLVNAKRYGTAYAKAKPSSETRLEATTGGRRRVCQCSRLLCRSPDVPGVPCTSWRHCQSGSRSVFCVAAISSLSSLSSVPLLAPPCPADQHAATATPSRLRIALPSPPVTQCINGHIICAECLGSILKSCQCDDVPIRCPLCRAAYGQTPIRNLCAEVLIGDCSGSCDGCLVPMLHKELAVHRLRCGEVTMDCPFHFAKCMVRPRQKDIDTHMQAAEAEHLALLAIAPVSAIDGIVAMLSGSGVATESFLVTAVNTLRNFADDPDNNLSIVRSGAIGPLVALLRGCGGENPKEAAAAALLNISANEDNRAAIARAGAIVPFVALLREEGGCGDGTKEAAAGALWNLAADPRNIMDIVRAGAIAPLVSLLSMCDGLRYVATGALRNLATNACSREDIEWKRAIPPLVSLLAGDASDEVKAAAARILQSLSVNADCSVAMVRAGAICNIMPLLRDGGHGGYGGHVGHGGHVGYGGYGGPEQPVVGLLRNLAADRNNHVAIARVGAIAPLVALLISCKIDAVTEAAAGALKNLAFTEDNQVAIARAGAIGPLVSLLIGDDVIDAVKVAAADAIRNLAANGNNRDSIPRAGAIAPLVALLIGDRICTIKEAAAGALQNLAFSVKNHVAIVRAGAIGPLVSLLSWGMSDESKKAAALALQNLAYSDDNKVAIAHAGAITPLVALLRGSCADEVKQVAATVLWSLADIDNNKVDITLSGGIGSLVALLSAEVSDGVKDAAAGALHNLASDYDIKAAIVRAGVMPLILARIRGGWDRRSQRCGRLRNADQI